MKKVLVLLIAVAAIVLLGIKGKGLLDQRKDAVAQAPLPRTEVLTVRTVTPRRGTLENSISLLAQVQPLKRITLSTKLAGYIKEIQAEASQSVKQGDLLIRIDDTEILSSIAALESALATQQSDLALAENIHRRNQKLYEIGGLPKEKLELSALSLEAKRSTIENSRQKIAQLKHQLSYLQITAPFDGVVDTLLLHQGDLAAAGRPILSISTTEKKLLITYVPDRASLIHVGQPVRLHGKEIGRIKTRYTTAQNGLMAAEVALSTALTSPSGSSLTVTLLTQSHQGCILPSDTLIHRADGIYLMGYSENSFTPQKVTLIAEQEGEVILSPCPELPVARGTETVLTSLPAYTHLKVMGETDAR